MDNLNFSPNFTWVIKSWEIGWGLSTHGVDEYIQNLSRKLWNEEATWGKNIKIHLKNTEYDDWNCIKLAQNKIK
jgi:hypothetical protein